MSQKRPFNIGQCDICEDDLKSGSNEMRSELKTIVSQTSYDPKIPEINGNPSYTVNDYKHKSNLLSGSTLDGIDTEFKMILLYHTAFEHASKRVQECSYDKCDNPNIVAEKFSRNFVESYQSHMAETKVDLLTETIQNVYLAVKKQWKSLLINIFGKTIDDVRNYVSTNPEKLDIRGYHVTNNGTVYHQDCYDDMIDDDSNEESDN